MHMKIKKSLTCTTLLSGKIVLLPLRKCTDPNYFWGIGHLMCLTSVSSLRVALRRAQVDLGHTRLKVVGRREEGSLRPAGWLHVGSHGT